MGETAIRRAGPADAGPLAALKRQTFRETFVEGFAIPYPAEDLATFEDGAYGVQAVTAELADPVRVSWLVERDGVPIGYAQIGPCKLPHPDVRPGDGELYQIYLLRAAQGGGLGRHLLALTLDELETRFPGPIWLGVWQGNHKAQAFYLGHGFENVGEYRFPVGQWQDEEFIFRRLPR